MAKCGIYLITVDRAASNKPPKFYVGHSVDIPRRRSKHFELLKTGDHKRFGAIRITNGIENRTIGINEELPAGWRRGMKKSAASKRVAA